MPLKVSKLQATVTIDVSENTTVGETDVNINGIVKQIIVEVPNLEGAGTVTLKVEDNDDYELYSKASISENATTVIDDDGTDRHLELALCGEMTLQVTATVAQVSDQDITVTMYYISE